MNLENVEAVKARINEIRSRFVDVQESRLDVVSRLQAGDAGFEEALRRAGSAKYIPCPAELEPVIMRAAERYGVNPAIIKAVIRAESGFRQDAVSRVGAQGLMQLMPGTARGLGVDPTDCEQNIDGGTRYLKQQMDRFGSLERALAAYNAGPASVVRYGGIPPYAETRNYVSQVLRNIAAYSEPR